MVYQSEEGGVQPGVSPDNEGLHGDIGSSGCRRSLIINRRVQGIDVSWRNAVLFFHAKHE